MTQPDPPAPPPRPGLAPGQRLTVIEPTAGWRMLDLGELWAYRELVWVLAARDVRVRYKQTVIGAAWAVLQPLLSVAIFTVVFGRLVKVPSDGMPYELFAYTGILPWTFVAAAVSAAGGSVVGSAHLISKVYFPRLVIPLASVGGGLVDLAVSSVVLLALMAYYGVGPTPSLAVLPLLVLLLVGVAVGVGTLLSALTVAYRDFRHVLPVLTQLWMYATPVVYPASVVPRRWRWVLYLNPAAGLVEGFRAAVLGRPFDGLALLLAGLVTVGLIGVGVAYFERVERHFADII